jgi:hypothetical protein
MAEPTKPAEAKPVGAPAKDVAPAGGSLPQSVSPGELYAQSAKYGQGFGPLKK